MKWEKFVGAGIRLPYYMHLYMLGKLIDAPKVGGWKHSPWLLQVEKQLSTIYFNPDEIELAAQWFKDNIHDAKFLENFLSAIHQIENRLLVFSQRLLFVNFKKASDQKLIDILNYFSLLFRIKFGVYGFPKIIDAAFTGLLTEILAVVPAKKDYALLVENLELSEYQKERLSHLKIVKKIIDENLRPLFEETSQEIIEKTGRFHPGLYHQLEKHTQNFAWLTTGHHVQPMNIDRTILSIKNSLRDSAALVELDNLLERNEKIISAHNQLIKKYQFGAKDLKIIEFLRQINHYSETRKAGMSKAVLWSYPLFQEIAERLNTDIVSLRQLTVKQITASLRAGSINPKHQTIIKKRLEYYLCLLHQNKIYELNGDEAKKYFEQRFSSVNQDIKELKGVVAHPGKAAGKARLILIEHQVEKLQEGEILISSMTDPQMLPAMKKAAAIVTDEGGTLCHAAIVARELKKPCLIATKIATKVFHDGDLIEVDADAGVVKKLS
ncbi:MAG: hypothetical protein HY569_02365 [Candidatus Magasanikbacteria bacterium]|nr:hypothetical protein [Candidatus Magasanikbacteria bacterium]